MMLMKVMFMMKLFEMVMMIVIMMMMVVMKIMVRNPYEGYFHCEGGGAVCRHLAKMLKAWMSYYR